MASTEIKTLVLGGNSYKLNDTTARTAIASWQQQLADDEQDIAALQTEVAGKQDALGIGTDTTTFLRNDGTWATPPTGSGTSDHDFTFTILSSLSQGLVIAESVRGYLVASASADVNLTLAVANNSDNYLLIKNTGSAEINVIISYLFNSSGTDLANREGALWTPSDGITVPAGGATEISIVVFDNFGVVTASSALTLN